MPTNERGPGMRLSSGPEHSLLTNRPVIVTQSDLPSSSPPPLQQRGSPYSSKSAAGRTHAPCKAWRLAARPLWIEGLGGMPLSSPPEKCANPRCYHHRHCKYCEGHYTQGKQISKSTGKGQ